MHRAVQPAGVTCTTIRRAHNVQNLGGSMASLRTQSSWPPAASGRPQWPQA
ncbi:MAG: hypothetical protein QOK14_729, partial [Frankiaceae bacterium]|nr:hypothetical protein [Frankiaceae bacterium]